VANFKPVGIKKKKGTTGDDITVPEFSMPPDAIPGIAQVIVDIWKGDASLANVTDKYQSGSRKGFATDQAVQQATDAINKAYPRFNLNRCVIITEKEHDDGYLMEQDIDVVFVLPKADRVDLTGANLLNSAKLLMACTPNGI
jgi:hypothetical protein